MKIEMTAVVIILSSLIGFHVSAQSSREAPRPATSMAEIRKRVPELTGLDDERALDVIHQVYYSDIDKADLAKRFGVTIKPPFVPKSLGPIDSWRYESCQQDASKAPTQYGVNVALGLCRKKFGQVPQ